MEGVSFVPHGRASFSSGTTAVEAPPIDLDHCRDVLRESHAARVNSFMGVPLKVMPTLRKDDWFVAVSQEMFDEIVKNRVYDPETCQVLDKP